MRQSVDERRQQRTRFITAITFNASRRLSNKAKPVLPLDIVLYIIYDIRILILRNYTYCNVMVYILFIIKFAVVYLVYNISSVVEHLDTRLTNYYMNWKFVVRILLCSGITHIIYRWVKYISEQK